MSSTTEQTIEIAGKRLVYEAPNGIESGPGHVILLVHGASFDRRYWKEVMEGLSESHRPICVDNPGHGASMGSPYTSPDKAANVLKEFHDRLGLGKFVMIGHSFGGAITQRYVAKNPDDVLGVGLISTAPHFGMPDDMVDRWRDNPEVYRQEEMDIIVAPDAPEEIRERLWAMKDGLAPGAQIADLNAVDGFDNRDKWLDIDKPALVMTAEHDFPPLKEIAPKWVDGLPNATYSEIPGASHMMMIEKPEETAKAIVDWVASIPLP